MMITSTSINNPNSQTIIASSGNIHSEVVTFTTIEHHDTNAIKVKGDLEKRVKSIKKDLKYATGLRKKELQQELQLTQRELKLLK